MSEATMNDVARVVLEAVRRAVLAEREACARVCDEEADADCREGRFIPNQAMRLAAEIRRRP